MNKKKLAEDNYKRFCQMEGCEYIASEYALYLILDFIDSFNVNSILELGLGIGSISDTVLRFHKKSVTDITYFGTETNDFCLKALRENVEDFSQIQLFNSLSEIPAEYKFDFIIVDGSDPDLEYIKMYCNERSLIFIEGDRTPQLKLVMSVFPYSRQVSFISLRKNKSYATGSTNNFVGGGRLIFTNPNQYMKYYWFKEKAQNFLKRRLRKFK